MPDETAPDTGALPETGPNAAPIFDTGPHPEPMPIPTAWSESADPDLSDPDWPVAAAEPDAAAAPAADPEPVQRPAQPSVVPASVVVPADSHGLRWWKLALALVAVWVPAAGVGLGLFSWWHSLADKTPAVYVTLVYITVCMVAALILAMVADRPLASAFAIALMSAVFASAVAAAPLYGHYYCQVRSPCVAGIIPS